MNRYGTLRTGLKNISPTLRELKQIAEAKNNKAEDDKSKKKNRFNIVIRPTKKIDGREICSPGCIVDTCQSDIQAKGIFKKKIKTRKRRSKKLKKRRTKKNRKLP